MTAFVPGGPTRYRHQRRMLRFLIEHGGTAAFLADAGTGKTAPTLDYASLLALKSPTQEARVLVFAPLAAVDTWVSQAATYVSPQVSVWAEALGGATIRDRLAYLAARGPSKPLRPPRALRGERRWWAPRAHGASKAVEHFARLPGDRGPVDRSWGPGAAAHPRLVIEVLNLDVLSSRSRVGSRTMADVALRAVQEYSPDLVVVDESHRIKSHSSNVSRLAARIGAAVPRRVILTGTVMPHALTMDSPILTPTGWKPMGEMRVGDRVIGVDGQPTEVVGVWPQGEKPIFTVTFSDGSTVDCTEDHLWTVTSRGRRSRGMEPLTLSTADLVKGRSRSRTTTQEIGLFDKGGAARWAIPTVEPVDFLTQSVPLDSYLLGLLLGDGHLGHSVDFTTADEEIAKYIEAALPEGLQLTVTPGQNGSRASRYRITSGKKGGSLPGAERGPAPNPVAVALDSLGLRHLRGPEKFIPEVYLWNDVETRLAVLRGLMDADGTASIGSTSKFVTSSLRLAEGVTHLVRSLGGYVTERVEQKQPTRMPQGHTSPARPQHVLLFGMPFNPFRVTRKAERWRPRTEQKLRTIVSIKPNGSALAQCITVAAEDGLFVTRDFVVTHNSPLDVYGQWRFLDPDAFTTGTVARPRPLTWSGFRARYAVMGGYMGHEVVGYKNLDDMQQVMAQRAITVRKADALDLPPVQDVTVPVHLSSAEQRAYDDLRKNLASQMDDGSTALVGNRLALSTRLRQITAGHLPDDTGVVHDLGDSKARTVASIVNDTLAGEQRVVVFAYFKREIDDLVKVLTAPGMTVERIDGATSGAERQAIRRRFGDTETHPERTVLVAQIRTVSLAVNEFVTARAAVFASLSQQRDDISQARDRLHRIGQADHVTYYYALAQGTVDTAIWDAYLTRTSIEDSVLRHIHAAREAD